MTGCTAHEALQRAVDVLTARWRVDVIDVRDPLIDLGVCPTCGADLTEPASVDAR